MKKNKIRKNEIRFFKFKVTYWDVIDEKESIDSGIAYGSTMGDAVDRICSIYQNNNGDDEIIDLSIFELDAFFCGVITEDLIKEEFKING